MLRENEREQQKANVIIQKLQAEINHLKSTNYSHNQASFDEVLKSLLEENKSLRLRIDESNE
jgi:predicted secreted acid phosphatase